MPKPTRNALLSVYDKTGIEDFAKALVELGWTIYSSGGTASVLAKAGTPVIDVAGLVGDAILGHRVVTLSREIHAGLLARPNVKEDMEELDKLGVPLFDLVCVDLYPLAAEIAKPESTPESVIEKTDIGGPTILRSAAKSRRIVISQAKQRGVVLEWLLAGEPDANKMRNDLAVAAEATVAVYALDSARYHSGGETDGLIGWLSQTAKYGENAWQTPAGFFTTYTGDPLAIHEFKLVAGAAPSYNNLAELNRHLQTMTHIAASWEINFEKVPYIALGTKHGNACGAAVADTPAEAVQKMVMGDLRAIFGGLVSLNFPVTKEVANELLTHGVDKGRRMLDAVIAPSFTPEAIEMLSRKGDKCRFLANPALANLTKNSLDTSAMFRPVRGGFLRQPNYTFVLDLGAAGLTRTADLPDAEQRDLVLAWAICSTSNSNTVTLVKNRQLIGNGVGQQDRVGCCELAIKRANDAHHITKGAVAASDSFFPFSDGPETLADAGIAAIWSTTGSLRDSDTQELCRKRQVALWQIPDSEGRGFFGH